MDAVVWLVLTKPVIQGKMGQWVLSAEPTLAKTDDRKQQQDLTDEQTTY